MAQINQYPEIETPCFIFDREEFERSVTGFQNALNQRFDRSIVGHSVKTNSLPFCLQEANRLGCYAEVVSRDEYELALLCGFPKDRIIYNGPMKTKESFLDSIMNGAIVNIETKRELQWLQLLPKNKFFNVGIRLNINISHVSPEDADGDNDNSRFGFSDETSEFKDAIDFIANIPNVNISGLHIHRTAHSRSIRFYRGSIQYACNVIKKYNLSLDYIDVGGGYFGIFPNKPTYQQYSAAFHEVLKANKLDFLCVIVEPGNAITASCFSFLSEVIDVKHVEKDCWFITTDGSRNDIDPFFKKSSYLQEELYQNKTDIVTKQIIAGCTCLEYDRLYELKNKPLLSVGDRIYYKNVGAYTMCLSPLFIRYYPKVYLKTETGYDLIRDRWSAQEYILNSKMK